MTRVQTIAAGSIFVGLLVLALKYAAYVFTGSVALLSDAIESIVNVITAIVALLAIRWSAMPADAEHPYGHAKAEYFSAVIEGVLIIVAALAIFHEAYFAFLTPRMNDTPWAGLVLNGAATLANAIWCMVLISRGKAMKSPALVADGHHLLSDVVSSIGVAGGVALAALLALPWLDAALAAAVALNVLWSGWKVMRESVGGLMDAAVPAEELTRLREIISQNADGAIEAHDLRTRHAGRMMFVDFHLVVPRDMTVSVAHDICDRIEAAIRAEFKDTSISVHVEPDGKAKHAGIVVL